MDIFNINTQEALERISRHCPEALSTYLHCLNRVGDDGVVYFTRDFVDVQMSEEWRNFRKNIKKLSREALLSWSPLDDGIQVILPSS